MATDLERFHACMEYRTCDRRPNHELGVWPQTRARWQAENANAIENFTWNWFVEEEGLRLDRREYIPVDFGFLPPFEPEVLEETPEYEVVRNSRGIVTKALKEGSIGGGRMCMDQYLEFPVTRAEDYAAIKERLIAAMPARYPDDLDERIAAW